MSDVFSSIGKIFSNPATGPILSGASTGLGAIGNLLAGNAQSKEENALVAQQNKVANLTPEQLSQMAVKAEGPINNSLIQAINNSVQGDMASRGLAQAPGIFAANEEQAIAPVVQQNYNTALQQVLTQLGLPATYADAILKALPGQQSMTPSMMLFLQQLAKLKSTNAGNGTFSGPGATQPTDDQLGVGQPPAGPTTDTTGTYDFGSLTPPSDNSLLSLLGATS
jgi:hypothetical protein